MVMSQALIGDAVPPRQRPRFQADFGMVFVLASVTGSALGGLVISHFSWRWLFLANLPLAALAVWRVRRLPPSVRDVRSAQPLIIGGLGIAAGLGFGTVMPTAQLVVQAVAGRSRLGAAAATVSLARSTGASLGTAVFGALVFGLVSNADLQAALHASSPAATQQVIRAFHLAFFCAGGLTLLSAWTSTRVPRVTI